MEWEVRGMLHNLPPGGGIGRNQTRSLRQHERVLVLMQFSCLQSPGHISAKSISATDCEPRLHPRGHQPASLATGGLCGQREGKLEQKAVNGAGWGGKLLSAATPLPPHPLADGLSWCPPAFLASSAVPPRLRKEDGTRGLLESGSSYLPSGFTWL